MAQDIVNENQKISYTNLDFSSIYTEVIDLIKQLTYRWDPSISDESDPGVVLVKLSSLIADKCNYNIDKNILETFPLSVTQNGNARQLYDQLGYYMNWYESASVPVLLSWVGETNDSSVSYTIPKFTAITDSESSHIYSLCPSPQRVKSTFPRYSALWISRLKRVSTACIPAEQRAKCFS